MAKVFINPGHSKKGLPDPGAVSCGFKESQLACKIGESLALKLKDKNIEW